MLHTCNLHNLRLPPTVRLLTRFRDRQPGGTDRKSMGGASGRFDGPTSSPGGLLNLGQLEGSSDNNFDRHALWQQGQARVSVGYNGGNAHAVELEAKIVVSLGEEKAKHA
eukprot:scaffold7381_cov310-Pinguiococcus_pyrenoidosus.AAC.94